MSHKMNPIIENVAHKCNYLLKIYIYGKKNGSLPLGAKGVEGFCGRHSAVGR